VAQPVHIREIVRQVFSELISGQPPGATMSVASGGSEAGRGKLLALRRQIKERGIRRQRVVSGA